MRTPIVSIVLLLGCAGCRQARPEPMRNCLVLSVGGSKGMAHIGAIDALRARQLPVDCVFGNSMGAVVGSLFVSGPAEDLTLRYRGFIAEYIRATATAKSGVGAASELLTGVRQLIEGQPQVGWTTILAAVAGGVHEVLFSEVFDNDRFRRVLDAYLTGVSIESLPIGFATSYQKIKGQGVALGIVTRGNLAEAVSRSANNPFIFKGTSLEYLDPGADRVSAVPIDDACQTFGPVRLLAVNVSGAPSYFRPDLPCAVTEVVLDLEDTPADAIRGEGPAFDALYRAGYTRMEAALGGGPLLLGFDGQ